MTAAAARFAAQWAAVASEGLVGLAVSGGPDSLALLLLACEVAPRNFRVATVDHGLRPEAAAEAAMVAAICSARNVPHQTLAVSLEKGAGVQERARSARYAALARWARAEGLPAIMTAHHADDQAETMVMRLNRGAGVRGVAAMRLRAPMPNAPDIALVRPLLDWRRSELQAVVDAAGLVAVDDPSNRDKAYERVRLRDALTSIDVFDVRGFAASARHLAEADGALDWVVHQIWHKVEPVAQGYIWTPEPDLPDVLAMRVLERALAELGASHPRGAELARWLDTLRKGGVATLGGVKGDARSGPWRFTRVPRHRT